jgi:hypothetical protein
VAASPRETAEARIPSSLLYTKGRPTCIPTVVEAELLAEVQQTVASIEHPQSVVRIRATAGEAVQPRAQEHILVDSFRLRVGPGVLRPARLDRRLMPTWHGRPVCLHWANLSGRKLSRQGLGEGTGHDLGLVHHVVSRPERLHGEGGCARPAL